MDLSGQVIFLPGKSPLSPEELSFSPWPSPICCPGPQLQSYLFGQGGPGASLHVKQMFHILQMEFDPYSHNRIIRLLCVCVGRVDRDRCYYSQHKKGEFRHREIKDKYLSIWVSCLKHCILNLHWALFYLEIYMFKLKIAESPAAAAMSLCSYKS